ncbi:unnamed protein product, partial [Symbiodinium necroappetens]
VGPNHRHGLPAESVGPAALASYPALPPGIAPPPTSAPAFAPGITPQPAALAQPSTASQGGGLEYLAAQEGPNAAVPMPFPERPNHQTSSLRLSMPPLPPIQ